MADLDRYLAAIARGDADAFAAWLAGAEPRVRASLHSFAARLDTEAVLQEALLRTWQVAPRFQPDGRPDGLVRLSVRIARNLAVSELRRARVDPVEVEQLERLAEAQGEGPALPDPLLRRLIERCRALLPERPALALAARLRAAGGQSDHELAQETGMSLNTFLQNVGRARRALAECLERQGVTVPGGAAPGGVA